MYSGRTKRQVKQFGHVEVSNIVSIEFSFFLSFFLPFSFFFFRFFFCFTFLETGNVNPPPPLPQKSMPVFWQMRASTDGALADLWMVNHWICSVVRSRSFIKIILEPCRFSRQLLVFFRWRHFHLSRSSQSGRALVLKCLSSACWSCARSKPQLGQHTLTISFPPRKRLLRLSYKISKCKSLVLQRKPVFPRRFG